MYIPRGVGYGTGRRYVLLGTGTVCRYVLWVRYGSGYGTGVRYGSTVRGYGTGGTVLGYGTGVRRTGTVYPPYLFSGNVVLFPKRYGGTSYRYSVPTVPVFRKCGAISKMWRY